MTRNLMTVDEAAEVLRVSPARMYALLREKVVPSVAVGRQRRVCPVTLHEFIRSGGKALPGGWRRAAGN